MYKSAERLAQHGLELALGAEVSVEAGAGAGAVVADSAPRAVSAGRIAQPLQGVAARGTLQQRAVWSSAADVAHAAHVHLRVPGRGVHAAGLHGQLLLGEADAGLVTVVGTHGALTGNSVVICETCAFTCFSVT